MRRCGMSRRMRDSNTKQSHCASGQIVMTLSALQRSLIVSVWSSTVATATESVWNCLRFQKMLRSWLVNMSEQKNSERHYGRGK